MTKIFDLKGSVKGNINLPSVFSTDFRPDLITRAFLVIRSNKRQAYGSDPLAGMRTSAHYHGVKDTRHSMKNKEIARMDRIHEGPSGLSMTARFVPQARKGRKVHPPLIGKNWSQKINKKENRFAIRSAIAATTLYDVIKKKSRIPVMDLPIIVENEFESLKKSSDVIKFLESIKLEAEMERAQKKKVRAGKGKMRGRKYKKKKSFLFVISKNGAIVKACKNIAGADVCDVNNLNVELLAPGAQAGRLTIFTESAIKKLGEIYG